MASTTIRKLVTYVVLAVGGAFLLGLLTWSAMEIFIPGCKCTLEHCNGCGVVGDALGRIVVLSSALGGMGLVLVVWFAPVVLALFFVFLLLRALYRKLAGSTQGTPVEANSIQDALGRSDRP